MVEQAQKALDNTDKKFLDTQAIQIDKHVFISHAGVLDSIILLGKEVIRSKEDEKRIYDDEINKRGLFNLLALIGLVVYHLSAINVEKIWDCYN